MKFEFSQHIFGNNSNIKFDENPYIGSGRTGRTDGQTTNMTKLIVAFRNFTNAPKKIH